jgi:hypothetical protein
MPSENVRSFRGRDPTQRGVHLEAPASNAAHSCPAFAQPALPKLTVGASFQEHTMNLYASDALPTGARLSRKSPTMRFHRPVITCSPNPGMVEFQRLAPDLFLPHAARCAPGYPTLPSPAWAVSDGSALQERLSDGPHNASTSPSASRPVQPPGEDSRHICGCPIIGAIPNADRVMVRQPSQTRRTVQPRSVGDCRMMQNYVKITQCCRPARCRAARRSHEDEDRSSRQY